jgi:rare lipoprotein A
MKYAAIVFALLLLAGCAGSHLPESPAPLGGDQVFVGLASYYGSEFAGRTTASGEKYDPSALTAAHRNLPFGTKALVTNLENNLSVLVTITDRGPQRADRIIDLSFAAARDLDMITAGVVKVRVEVVRE